MKSFREPNEGISGAMAGLINAYINAVKEAAGPETSERVGLEG